MCDYQSQLRIEKHKKSCQTPQLTEGDNRRAFLAAFNEVLGNRAEIMEAYREVMKALTLVE
ncbi:MAG: hypothetical protein HFH97_15955 [Lachnospiraceae bacterium]|nr:hypothetical protein [uncultured Acetatifactor sp.]MCI9574069.1 hypothetical protein [Lachnospiraceae bacterium]